MNDFNLDEQQLEALRPLAAVIEGAIKDTPIRLGTDDWGTMLAAGILVRVAAYMGGELPPVAQAGDWLTRGTRDLSIPEQATPADEDAQTLRLLRREGLLVLLSRLQRGRPVTEAEADTLRTHVETEIREADTARSVAAGNKRHVQVMYGELEQVREHLRYVLDYRGPSHDHQVPGRWDHDDSPCDHCVRLASARAVLDGTKQS